MSEDLKLSQIGTSQLPPPFRGLHSPGVRKHCQITMAVISGNHLFVEDSAMNLNPRMFPHTSFWLQKKSVENSALGSDLRLFPHTSFLAKRGGGEERIHTPKRFKRTLFVRTKHNIRIGGVIPFIKLKNDTHSHTTVKR